MRSSSLVGVLVAALLFGVGVGCGGSDVSREQGVGIEGVWRATLSRKGLGGHPPFNNPLWFSLEVERSLVDDSLRAWAINGDEGPFVHRPVTIATWMARW